MCLDRRHHFSICRRRAVIGSCFIAFLFPILPLLHSPSPPCTNIAARFAPIIDQRQIFHRGGKTHKGITTYPLRLVSLNSFRIKLSSFRIDRSIDRFAPGLRAKFHRISTLLAAQVIGVQQTVTATRLKTNEHKSAYPSADVHRTKLWISRGTLRSDVTTGRMEEGRRREGILR